MPRVCNFPPTFPIGIRKWIKRFHEKEKRREKGGDQRDRKVEREKETRCIGQATFPFTRTG